jgi:DNA (cytosine-5)-methyltransferase 1
MGLAVNGTSRAAPLVADLCCGMGGLSLAASSLGMRVTVGVDVNAQAVRTFSKNFPDAEFVEGSVRSSKVLRRCAELLETADGFPIVVSGPPCQGFSIAGSRDPVDPRNQIFTAVARAIAQLNPHCALVENVSMVLAKKNAVRLKQFENILSRAGYFVHSVLVDAADFGVPQRRRRVFFLITRRKLEPDLVGSRLQQLRQPEVSVEKALQGLPRPAIRPEHYRDEEDCDVFTNHFAMRHTPQVVKKIAALDPGTGPMSYRRLHPSRPSKTLFSGHRAPPAHFLDPRSITVREAARLQGFPDDFRIYGSFANQMQQVTDAVPPPLAEIVLRVLAEVANVPVPIHA